MKLRIEQIGKRYRGLVWGLRDFTLELGPCVLGLLALGAGAIFVPALALAAGVWTGNSRLFEVVFVVLWYIGAINHVPVLDFMGVTDSAIGMHIPLVYAMAAIALHLLALVGRRQQLKV